MAKLRVSEELLMQSLFGDDSVGVHLEGLWYDGINRQVVMEISGMGVPDAEEITCVVYKERTRMEFVEVK